MTFVKNVILLGVMILIASIFFEVKANELDCIKNPIFCQIIKNAPEINRSYAFELSNAIFRVSKRHDIPIKIFVAILMQESRYKLEAKGCHIGVRPLTESEYKRKVRVCDSNDLRTPTPTCEESVKNKLKVDRVCSDLGLSQIYVQTAQKFNFDLHRLTSDLEYSVEAGAIVLADFKKRYSKRESTWWTRYNASNKEKREIYRQLVNRYIH